MTATFALVLVEASAQPVMTNPSFEADAVPPNPGYGAITGWTAGDGIGTGYGLNEVHGAFADNGTIPEGTKVAFMQSNGTLSQEVSGFTVGAQYWLTYRENARFGCCGGTATLSVNVNGSSVIAEHTVASVGGTKPYLLVGSTVFGAASPTLTVAFVKGGTGDGTTLIDHIQIVEIPPNTPPMITRQPQAQLVDPGEPVSFTGAAVGTAPLYFQWRFNGIALAGETNAMLTLAEVDPYHAGTYSFVVTNAAGSATSSIAPLTVRSDSPALINPSFERDTTPPYPGYGPIFGWQPGGGLSDGYGMNELNGAFADNGAIPRGTKVAFIQDNGTLSQTVAGFTIGGEYWLTYRENARGNCCGERIATLSVTVGGTAVVPDHPVAIVGGLNPYHLVTSEVFTASETGLTISFMKAGTGDATALMDDVRIFTRNKLQLGITLQDGNAPAIRIKGTPGWKVTLEYSHSLAPGAPWPILTSFILTGGLDLFVDRAAPASSPRFYRARQAP